MYGVKRVLCDETDFIRVNKRHAGHDEIIKDRFLVEEEVLVILPSTSSWLKVRC